MNKKHLSVVMAGAMLATTVAPVLAADRTVNDSNKGLLIEELRNKILSKSFEDLAMNKNKANKRTATVDNKLDLDGVHKSVYAVEVVAPKIEVKDYSLPANSTLVGDKVGANKAVAEVNKYLTEKGVKGLTSRDFKLVKHPSTNQVSLVANKGFYSVVIDTDTPWSDRTHANKDASVLAASNRYKITAMGITANQLVFDEASDRVNGDTTAMEETLKIAPKGTLVKVWNRGFEEADGKVYNHYLKDDMAKAPKYDERSMQAVADLFERVKDNSVQRANNFSDAVHNVSYKNGELTIEVRKSASETTYTEVKCKAGDTQLDLKRVYNKDNEEISDKDNEWRNFDHFGLKVDRRYQAGSNIPRTLVETIEISDETKLEGIALSNVYDGLFLTENGEKLLAAMNEYEKKPATHRIAVNGVNSDRGLYTINITFEKTIRIPNSTKTHTEKEVVTITSNNRAQMEVFLKGINNTRNYGERRFPAQILAGSNRYATAVKVAKENADITKVAENGNIVLVNGNALVDGLAAAPLAASVCNLEHDSIVEANKNYVAPILLTNTDGIPKETRDYMKEVIGEQRIKDLDEVTVYLVGGEAVISKSVENNLKEMGLRVVRAGGKDREATSLEVAELMNTKEMTEANKPVNEEGAFLVGADGEADAMSIAPVAAATKTPIIVESRKGLSDDALDFFKKYKKEAADYRNVVIVGGEAVVSKDTAEKLKAKDVDTYRVAGDNRQKTNAKVIDTFYGVQGTFKGFRPVNPGHKFDNVVVSKDGQRNKSELIDALTATSLATKHNAPIVLGTNKLAKEQINVLELRADRNDPVYIYQVGNGVAREVVKTIAERIGLAAR